MEKKKLLISFSGGRTSAFMTQWLLANKQNEFEMIVVFSNTGKERKETLDFIEKCDKYFGFNVVWIEPVTNPEYGHGIRSKVVSYETANRTGQPFEDIISKYSVPNMTSPFCSEYMKKYAINSYAKSIGWKNWFTAIGIRVDEFDRMSAKRKKERLIYPLIQMVPTKKNDINKYWLKMPFDLELKSYGGNCDLCWKKSLRKHLTILKQNPTIADWWLRMEQKYENFIPPGRKQNVKMVPPLRFFRGKLSVSDLLKLSLEPFELARDESKDVIQYQQMEIEGLELDSNNGCEESCEAF